MADDPDWRVQQAMAWVLSDVRDPRAVDGLLRLYQMHKCWLVQAAAADALNEIIRTSGYKPHRYLTFKTINSIWLSRRTNWVTGWASLRLMGTLCASTDCEQMRFYLFAGTWLERREAASALGRVGGRDVLEQLREVARMDVDGRVRDEADKAISAIQQR